MNTEEIDKAIKETMRNPSDSFKSSLRSDFLRLRYIDMIGLNKLSKQEWREKYLNQKQENAKDSGVMGRTHERLTADVVKCFKSTVSQDSPADCSLSEKNMQSKEDKQ